ncbi:hypothetical protein [Kaistia nematophila]|uniref:GAF domain-containing protein n=1 Tax=Kaistia nematophila TaxID=2994654 RepID=A0A9X3E2M4_9HYPH|nr:hypothetical protein [Kaistia nematophila]MCX5570222.1 hypothetical protein [Kaistia nematophila]
MAVPFDIEHVARIVAGPNAAANLFAYLHAGINRDVGCGLLTASVYDIPNLRSRRVFSEDVEAYPLGNFKRLDKNLYFETVLAGRRHFSSTTIEEIAGVFFDWEKIQALGFESNMNLPAIANDTVIGTINLLEKKGHYTAERVEKALAWQPIVTLAFLLLASEGSDEANFQPGLSVARNAGMEGGAATA